MLKEIISNPYLMSLLTSVCAVLIYILLKKYKNIFFILSLWVNWSSNDWGGYINFTRKLSIKFRVFAVPNERSSHDSIIPATGGVALCISWIILIFIYSVLIEQNIGVELYFYVLAGVLISIVGFYDDLNELPSFVKLLLQIFIFFIISFGDNSLINSFHGVLGIYELSYFESLVFSLFVFIVIVNAINLVDGIDGLSGSLTLFFLIITSYFYFESNYHYSHLVVSFCFSLSVFLFFNYSEN